MSILNDFELKEEGTGAVVAVGDAGFRCTAAGADVARLDRTFPGIAGVTYKATFQARIVSGSGGTVPYFAIDYPAAASLAERLDLGSDWKTYTTSFTVPFDADSSTEIVTFTFGIFSSTDGVIEYADVKFSDDRAQYYEELTTLAAAVYEHPSGTIIADALADVYIARVGNLVTITAKVTFDSLTTTANVRLANSFLPTWAAAIIKTTQFSEFATTANTFTACDVNNGALTDRDFLMFNREIGAAGITDSDFVAGVSNFSISYIAKSVGLS